MAASLRDTGGGVVRVKFNIARREKFAAVVLSSASRVALTDPLEVTGGLWVLPYAPVDVGRVWRQWIGSIRADEIAKANFWILAKRRSATPDILDQENRDFSEEAHRLFLALLTVGAPSYQHAYVLSGANVDGVPDVRQFGDLPHYLKSRGRRDFVVGRNTINRAHRARPGLEAVFTSPNHTRLKRGIRAFWNGLIASPPQDRLHQFVRCVEAAVKPRLRGTAVHFAERCRIFLRRDGRSEAVIKECYDLRSAAEHLRDEDNVLRIYPQADREEIYYRRVRQIESLARHVLFRILTAPNVQANFQDGAIDQFWNTPEATQRRLWGTGVNILGLR